MCRAVVASSAVSDTTAVAALAYDDKTQQTLPDDANQELPSRQDTGKASLFKKGSTFMV